MRESHIPVLFSFPFVLSFVFVEQIFSIYNERREYLICVIAALNKCSGSAQLHFFFRMKNIFFKLSALSRKYSKLHSNDRDTVIVKTYFILRQIKKLFFFFQSDFQWIISGLSPICIVYVAPHPSTLDTIIKSRFLCFF